MRHKKHITAVDIRSFSAGANLFFNIFLALFAISCLVPFIFIIIISLTKETDLTIFGYQFWPKHFSITSYQYLSKFGSQVVRSLGVTIFVTVIGTIMNTMFSATYAYAISRNEFRYRRFFTMFALVSMLFAPGMIPTYLVVTQMLNLRDNVWALILPMAFGVYNVLIMRTFYKTQVPDAIVESARIDGAGDLRIFAQIVVPLAVPGIATISLFTALGYWNDWMNALLYINNDNLVPLQYLLVRIQNNMDALVKSASQSAQLGAAAAQIPTEGTRMAMVVIATLPIALTYPFFQKYFVKGMTIGGVKG
ncbi:carbohydrate ABC transporter permease [Schleiferilactobacillus shenzhenensis]|uniref:carbohydrate ABC transporter permease n=1 Tax=Schleiferilactobacillus shenzhenensis TaxID=1231337 RepID=UPI0003F9F397|nr:carbohydrate ABC transporter permease [Schleiferilactobacillus shenzhenensis]